MACTYISDCGFYNFGVVLSEDATEHVIVIIDAGSRKICTGPKVEHSEMKRKFVWEFWSTCRKRNEC